MTVTQRVDGPLVSTIIPSYNHARYLPQAIASCLEQSYQPIEVIVVDDGSTDDTPRVAASYGSRIHYVRQRNRGLSAARNTGLRHAKGEYVQFLDADDWILPEKIDECMHAASGATKPVMVYCDYCRYAEASGLDMSGTSYYLTPRLNPLHPLLDVATAWEATVSVPAHCWLISSTLLSNMRFDPRLPNHEDWDMWLALLSREPALLYVDRKLAVYRRSSISMSAANRRPMAMGFLMAIRKQRRRFRRMPEMVAALDAKEEWVRHHYADALGPQRYAAWYWSPRVRAMARALLPFGPRQMIRRMLERREPHA